MTVGDWTSRVAETIELTSPMGQIIKAKWKGDSVSITKSVQRDRIPLMAGEIGKDMGSTAKEFPISIFFDGMFCDLLAKQFEDACTEIGTWQVNHPVHGMKTLLLLRVRGVVAPIESGGVIEFETDWFEPLDLMSLFSAVQLASLVAGLAENACVVSATAFDMSAFNTGFGDISSCLAMASVAGEIVKQAVGTTAWIATVTTSAVNVAKDRYDTSSQSLESEVEGTKEDRTAFDPEALSLAVSGMAMATSFGNTDGEKVLSNWESATDDMIAQLPSGAAYVGTADANRAYTMQTALEASVAAVCSAMAYSDRQTRAQAVEAAQRLSALFAKVVDALDVVMEEFSGLRADRQYYAQTETYAVLNDLVAQTVKFLLRQTFDLAIEKRITLDRDKAPIQICFEEYGPDGDDRFDDFIEWNQLEGDDILILPASREVVLYVEAQ
jgi:hypothetical protein